MEKLLIMEPHNMNERKESVDKYLHKYAGSKLHKSPIAEKLPFPDINSFSSLKELNAYKKDRKL